MSVIRTRRVSAGLVLCMGLAGLTACSKPGGATVASTSSTTRAPSSTTSSSPTGAAPSPSTTPPPAQSSSPGSLSPASIVILAQTKTGSASVLTVRAPAATRFGVGKGVMDAVDCTATVVTSGNPTAYRVVCPAAPVGSKLVATVPMGDFDVSFLKPL